MSRQRQAARHLVRHAARVLHPIRPAWSDVMESELEHICGVRASYLERYRTRFRPQLAAGAIGITLAALNEIVSGTMAALPWPGWYGQFARLHKHLGLELWSIVADILPGSVMAAGFGALLAHLTRKSSVALPWLAVGVWFGYVTGAAYLSLAATCRYPLQILWNDFLRFPTCNLLGIALPACALVVGFSRSRRIGDS